MMSDGPGRLVLARRYSPRSSNSAHTRVSLFVYILYEILEKHAERVVRRDRQIHTRQTTHARASSHTRRRTGHGAWHGGTRETPVPRAQRAETRTPATVQATLDTRPRTRVDPPRQPQRRSADIPSLYRLLLLVAWRALFTPASTVSLLCNKRNSLGRTRFCAPTNTLRSRNVR